MSFGDPSKGAHYWTIPIDDARPVVRAALDAGITVFDTANLYSNGSSEEIIGALLHEAGVRDDIVLATKVWARMGPGPNGGGLFRAAIMRQIDASLRRLKTDYVDLYQIHRFDPHVPVEETMEALNDLVRQGKVRYIGASSMFAWQFAKMQHAADLNRWTPFVSTQDQYNLLMREEEREMHPLCGDRGVGVMGWSPLARGRLAIAWGDTTSRIETDALARCSTPGISIQIAPFSTPSGGSPSSAARQSGASRPGLGAEQERREHGDPRSNSGRATGRLHSGARPSIDG